MNLFSKASPDVHREIEARPPYAIGGRLCGRGGFGGRGASFDRFDRASQLPAASC